MELAVTVRMKALFLLIFHPLLFDTLTAISVTCVTSLAKSSHQQKKAAGSGGLSVNGKLWLYQCRVMVAALRLAPIITAWQNQPARSLQSSASLELTARMALASRPRAIST
jgi:hypothetical protein